MFPEYREVIERLKAEGTNHRFLHLVEKHGELDEQIATMEKQDAGAAHAEIAALKKEKLHIKDQLHTLLRDAAHDDP